MTLSEHLGLCWEKDPLGARKLMERLLQDRWQF